MKHPTELLFGTPLGCIWFGSHKNIKIEVGASSLYAEGGPYAWSSEEQHAWPLYSDENINSSKFAHFYPLVLRILAFHEIWLIFTPCTKGFSFSQNLAHFYPSYMRFTTAKLRQSRVVSLASLARPTTHQRSFHQCTVIKFPNLVVYKSFVTRC